MHENENEIVQELNQLLEVKSITKKIKFSSYVFLLLSSTGAGKTKLTTVFTNPKARKYVSKAVGDTNSTVLERFLIFREIQNIITVGFKIKSSPISSIWYDGRITKIVSVFVDKFANKNLSKDEIKVEIRNLVSKYFLRSTNVNGAIYYVEKMVIDEVMESIVKILTTLFCEEPFFALNLYNGSKSLLTGEKNHPAKVTDAINRFVEEQLPKILDDEVKEDLHSGLLKLNANLRTYFNRQYKLDFKNSSDDYTTYDVNLDCVSIDEDLFLNDLFKNNNFKVTSEKKEKEELSLEVFCEELYIYLPMNPVILDLIKEDSKLLELFTDASNEIAFGIKDTRGLFHKEEDINTNVAYANELIYKADFNAIICLTPLVDSNKNKLLNVYENVFENYSADTPVYYLFNKMDKFYDDYLNNKYESEMNSYDDEFGISEIDIDFERIDKNVIDDITNFELNYINRIKDIQHKRRKATSVMGSTLWLVKSVNLTKEIADNYQPLKVVQNMIKGIADYENIENERHNFYLKEDQTELSFIFNSGIVYDIISNHLKVINYDKTVLVEAMNNIIVQLLKTPHGQSFNKLVRNISLGLGSKSEIDEYHFKNVQSIDVDFPTKIEKIINANLLGEIIENGLVFIGGEMERQKELLEKLKNEVANNTVLPYRKRAFNQQLFYHNTLVGVLENSKYFGFKGNFDGFLEESKMRITGSAQQQFFLASIATSLDDLIINFLNRNVRYVRV